MGEENGREYHFVTRDVILSMQDRNAFLEVCDVHGNLYGTSVSAVQAVESQHKICLIEIDVKGAQKLRERTDGAIIASYIFISAPIEELRKRITGRGADDETTLQRRLLTAQSEYAFLESHSDFFDANIVNDDFNVAYEHLVACINEQLTRHGMEVLSHSWQNSAVEKKQARENNIPVKITYTTTKS